MRDLTVAAVDCGTNSIRLLVSRRDRSGTHELARETRLARLGQGVDATGQFHPEALARANAVFEEYAALIAAHGEDVVVRVVATSAARDVSNREEFERGVEERLGVKPDVISGDEEARLSSTGVLSGVDVPAPSLIIDIGGGSTELVVVGENDEIRSAVSLDIGAVRIDERFLHTDPPTVDEVEAAETYINEVIDSAGVEFGALRSAIGVAGTVTSFAARVLGLSTYHREAVHQHLLTRDDIESTTTHWLTTPVAQITEEPCMHPLRAQVIGGGAVILRALSQRVPSGDVLVSETDILDGIALAMLAEA